MCELLQFGDLRIHSSAILGGMTNLNVLATSDGAEFVLKFSGIKKDYHDNPYLDEFAVLEYFSKRRLCPKPLATGFVDLSGKIPFLAYYFESGQIYSSIEQVSSTQWNLLLAALEDVHDSLPPAVKEPHNPLEFLSSLTSGLQGLEFEICSQELRAIHSSFDSSVSDFQKSISKWAWIVSTIHGDLRLSNILFQEGNVILLDWEHCKRASRLYDFAYFLIEPMMERGFPVATPLGHEPQETRNRMTVLALVSVLSWTIERLYYLELDMVEPNLLPAEPLEDLMAYAKSKQHRLSSILNGMYP